MLCADLDKFLKEWVLIKIELKTSEHLLPGPGLPTRNMEQEASLRAALTGTLTFLSYSGVFWICLISSLFFRGSSNFAGHMMEAEGVSLTPPALTRHRLDLSDNILHSHGALETNFTSSFNLIRKLSIDFHDKLDHTMFSEDDKSLMPRLMRHFF